MDNPQFFSLFYPDDRQRVAQHMERIARNSKDMLEICKGKFEILSEPGKGARIKISIPL